MCFRHGVHLTVFVLFDSTISSMDVYFSPEAFFRSSFSEAVL